MIRGCSLPSRSWYESPIGETTTITLNLSVRQIMDVTFWARTNTVSGASFLRFYIDGVLQLELSGVNPWTLYSYPVLATGAGGPDRQLKWEFSRSASAGAFTAWVDDIDYPEWNTQPSVPELLNPTPNSVSTSLQPTFEWRSFDPDYDQIS